MLTDSSTAAFYCFYGISDVVYGCLVYAKAIETCQNKASIIPSLTTSLPCWAVVKSQPWAAVVVPATTQFNSVMYPGEGGVVAARYC
jgi:hypothetical protein